MIKCIKLLSEPQSKWSQSKSLHLIYINLVKIYVKSQRFVNLSQKLNSVDGQLLDISLKFNSPPPFHPFWCNHKSSNWPTIMEKSVGTVSYTHVQFVTTSPLFNVEKDIMYSVVIKSIKTLTDGKGGRVNHFYRCLFSMETQEM